MNFASLLPRDTSLGGTQLAWERIQVQVGRVRRHRSRSRVAISLYCHPLRYAIATRDEKYVIPHSICQPARTRWAAPSSSSRQLTVRTPMIVTVMQPLCKTIDPQLLPLSAHEQRCTCVSCKHVPRCRIDTGHRAADHRVFRVSSFPQTHELHRPWVRDTLRASLPPGS